MSFDNVQHSFVRLADGGVDPSKIPGHYKAFYDRALAMFKRFPHFGGTTEVHANYWPLLCLMADQQKRIEALEAEKAVKASPPPPPAVDKPSPNPKVDMRTKEGRELRKQELTAAGV